VQQGIFIPKRLGDICVSAKKWIYPPEGGVLTVRFFEPSPTPPPFWYYDLNTVERVEVVSKIHSEKTLGIAEKMELEEQSA